MRTMIIVRYHMPRDWKFRAVVCDVTIVMTVATAGLVGWITPERLLEGWASEAKRGAVTVGLMPLKGKTRSSSDSTVLGGEKTGH